jgi:hypothetical protein
MGEFHLSLGTTIDVVTPDELSDALTGLSGHIDEKFRQQDGRFLWRTLAASTFQSFNGGAYQMVLEPQRPAMGKVWSVRRVTVTGTDDVTTVANLKAALYVGDPYTFTLGQLVTPGQAIPYVDFFTTKAVVVRDTEALFVNFTNSGGAVNFQGLQASVLVEEYNLDEIGIMRQ